MNIIEAIEHPEVFRPLFGVDLSPWWAWMTALRCMFGLELDDQERRPVLLDLDGTPVEMTARELATHCTGGTITAAQEHVGHQVREAYLPIGRRGGKSRVTSLVSSYLGTMIDYRAYLAPGERCQIISLAAARDQAEGVLSYQEAAFRTPALRDLVIVRGPGGQAATLDDDDDDEGKLSTNQTIRIRNTWGTRIDLKVRNASFRTVRSATIAAAIADELAFWWTDTSNANPDVEIMRALRPAMATIPMAMLFGISSPYAKRGVLFDNYDRYWGKPFGGRVLVWQAATWVMNPVISREFLLSERDDDPAAFRSEYGAEFRDDIEGYVSAERVDELTIRDRQELPPLDGVNYSAFVDPSGGRVDAMTLGIAHREVRADGTEVIVEDVNRSVKPPFDPSIVAAEFSKVMKAYRCRRCRGDRFGGEWVTEAFKANGVTYEPADLNRSELYLEFMPLLSSRKVELLDIREANDQLKHLERRRGRNVDIVDHPRGKHDDRANARAGACIYSRKPKRKARIIYGTD